jgi:ABC-type lipoprotein release transport system permease subunit
MVAYLAIRNLCHRRARYAVLALAVFMGFSLVTLVSGAAFGAMAAVRAKAARYFAGELSVNGFYAGAELIAEPAALEEALAASGLPFRTVAPRVVYYRMDASLIFGGESVRQRRLVGLDFEREAAELRGLAMADGSAAAMAGPEGSGGILISSAAAALMGARTGDAVQLVLRNDTGQYTTAVLVVRGVFNETGLFSYIAYMRQDDLNRLLGRPEGSATEYALYARGGRKLSAEVYDALAGRFQVYPVAGSKDELWEYQSRADPGQNYAVMPLESHLAQINDLLEAFLYVTYAVLALFIAMLMVGVLNTYRVVVYERTAEIGAMRALGMRRGAVARAFIAEALGLGLVASAAGLAAGAALGWILGFINLSGVPAAGLFTQAGRLVFSYPAAAVALNFFLFSAAVVAAAAGPSLRAARVTPAQAMRDAG